MEENDDEIKENVDDNHDENLIYIDSVNKYININKDVPITSMKSNFAREYESMSIIKSAMDLLHQEIDFLKDEIREKNLLIKILNFRNANDGDKVNIELFDENQLSSVVETTPETTTNSTLTDIVEGHNNTLINNSTYDARVNLVDYDDSDISNSSQTINDISNIHEPITAQIETYKLLQKKMYENMRAAKANNKINDCYEEIDETFILNSTPACSNDDTKSTNNSPSNNDGKYKYSDKFKWEQYSTGIASKILDKMGFKGKGLGKCEDGITEPITIDSSVRFQTTTTKEDANITRSTICILSDSMLNTLDDKRMSNKNCNVKIQCHGGCTVQCMYSHLPWAVKQTPDHIILHIGTNDCTRKTSDEVIKEILTLKEHIKMLLPSCKIWTSLPTMRTDSTRPNVIIKNLNVKMRKLTCKLIDNSNINEHDLGRKGLHLNGQGTRKIASNILSLIKRL